MTDEKHEHDTHPSYGKVTLTRSNGRFTNLFGSNIETNHAVTLTISEASRDHHLGQDWIHSTKQVVSITLSPLQYAEMLSSMGMGDGTPCTIEYNHGPVESPPVQEAQARQVVRKFIADTKDIADFAKGSRVLVDDILSKGGKMKAADRQALKEILGKMAGLVEDSAPFLMQRAEEHIQTMIAEAKATITQHAVSLQIAPDTASIPTLGMGEEVPHGHSPTGCITLGESPEIPELPPREIDSKFIKDMNAREVAELIDIRLKALEHKDLNGVVGTKQERARFFWAGAREAKGKVSVIYINYQGPTTIDLDEAKLYLHGLNDGFEGRHFEFFRNGLICDW